MNRGGVPLNFYEGGEGLKKLSVGGGGLNIFFLTKRQIDMIDVDVSFVNISANNDDNDNNSPLGQNFSQILAEFQHVGDNR